MNDTSLEKFNCFKNDVVFIDGLWGTGKSIIAPIIGAMDGVEKQKIEHIYEYLCVLRYLDKIQPDAVDSLLKTYSDLSQYNNLVGREVNLRLNDDSGPLNNPNSFRYIKRMFGSEGDEVVSNINENNLALNIMSHMIAQVSEPLVNAFGNRLKIIEMVRHPLYMVTHWHSYLSRFDGEREFTLSINFDGNKVPWFASAWKEKYIELSVMDRALYSINHLYEMLFTSLENLKVQNCEALVIPFESFVLEPEVSINSVEAYLGRNHSKKIDKILKQQKVPRAQISLGRGHQGYGWKADQGKTEQDVYKNHLDFIQGEASDDCLELFNSLIGKYNKKWPSVLTQYH